MKALDWVGVFKSSVSKYVHPNMLLDVELILVREETSLEVNRIIDLWTSDVNVTS